MRESIDRYDAVAAGMGARSVHYCWVNSVPSDLGVLLLHQAVGGDGAATWAYRKPVAVHRTVIRRAERRMPG